MLTHTHAHVTKAHDANVCVCADFLNNNFYYFLYMKNNVHFDMLTTLLEYIKKKQ